MSIATFDAATTKTTRGEGVWGKVAAAIGQTFKEVGNNAVRFGTMGGRFQSVDRREVGHAKEPETKDGPTEKSVPVPVMSALGEDMVTLSPEARRV